MRIALNVEIERSGITISSNAERVVIQEWGLEEMTTASQKRQLMALLNNPHTPLEIKEEVRRVLHLKNNNWIMDYVRAKVEPLEKITKKEAEYLLANRTNPQMQALIVAQNMVRDNPLIQEYRAEWNSLVRDWRAERQWEKD